MGKYKSGTKQLVPIVYLITYYIRTLFEDKSGTKQLVPNHEILRKRKDKAISLILMSQTNQINTKKKKTLFEEQNYLRKENCN